MKNKKVIIRFTVQYGIYLDLYTAWKVILDLPNGSSNVTFQAVYSSKYIPVLYSKTSNNL